MYSNRGGGIGIAIAIFFGVMFGVVFLLMIFSRSLGVSVDEETGVVTGKEITPVSKTILFEDDAYILSISVRQNHLSLDIGTHLKDVLNKTYFEIPVAKEFYEVIEVGDVINDSFRFGSLLTAGSVGEIEIRVENKYMIPKEYLNNPNLTVDVEDVATDIAVDFDEVNLGEVDETITELEESEIEEVVETEEIIEDVSEKVSEMELEAE